MSPASILIIDPHAAMRDGVVQFFSASPSEWTICGAEPDAVRGIAIAVRDQPHLAIVEYEGHGMDGIELAARLKEISATIEVLLYTGVSSPYALHRIFHSRIAGCVLKTEALCELGRGLETIRGHHRFRSREITGRCEGMENGRALLGTLTRCEMETLRLTCAGKSVKEIASHRGVSGKTVDTQRSH